MKQGKEEKFQRRVADYAEKNGKERRNGWKNFAVGESLKPQRGLAVLEEAADGGVAL
jgi:hypothetical protein